MCTQTDAAAAQCVAVAWDFRCRTGCVSLANCCKKLAEAKAAIAWSKEGCSQQQLAEAQVDGMAAGLTGKAQSVCKM